MTVGELIAKLQAYEQDMMVVVDGYEGGVKELVLVYPTEVILDYHKGMSYYGQHEVADSAWLYENEIEQYKKTKAVYLKR